MDIRCSSSVVKKPAGFTLIELMLVVTIVAIMAALAVPSFSDAINKNRVKGATEELYGLILQAKSESTIRNTATFLNLNTAASPWCAGYATTAGCDCTDTTSCVVPVAGTNVTQIVNGTEYGDVTITESFAGTGTSFTVPRNTVSDAGTISITLDEWQLDIQISTQGLIRVCNPNSNFIPGYDEC